MEESDCVVPLRWNPGFDCPLHRGRSLICAPKGKEKEPLTGKKQSLITHFKIRGTDLARNKDEEGRSDASASESGHKKYRFQISPPNNILSQVY